MKNLTPAALGALAKGDLENFIAAATPGGIEAQEARGQRDFVASQTLPKECQRTELERLGFVFGKDADDLFVTVEFPSGWTKKATGHSMWSDLVDDKSRRRGGIFYKAAFYDRSAHMRLDTFFKATSKYGEGDAPSHYFVANALDEAVFDGGLVDRKAYAEQDAAHKRCTAWLDANYPDWKNPAAYWD